MAVSAPCVAGSGRRAVCAQSFFCVRASVRARAPPATTFDYPSPHSLLMLSVRSRRRPHPGACFCFIDRGPPGPHGASRNCVAAQRMGRCRRVRAFSASRVAAERNKCVPCFHLPRFFRRRGDPVTAPPRLAVAATALRWRFSAHSGALQPAAARRFIHHISTALVPQAEMASMRKALAFCMIAAICSSAAMAEEDTFGQVRR